LKAQRGEGVSETDAKLASTVIEAEEKGGHSTLQLLKVGGKSKKKNRNEWGYSKRKGKIQVTENESPEETERSKKKSVQKKRGGISKGA